MQAPDLPGNICQKLSKPSFRDEPAQPPDSKLLRLTTEIRLQNESKMCHQTVIRMSQTSKICQNGPKMPSPRVIFVRRTRPFVHVVHPPVRTPSATVEFWERVPAGAGGVRSPAAAASRNPSRRSCRAVTWARACITAWSSPAESRAIIFECCRYSRTSGVMLFHSPSTPSTTLADHQ